MATATVPGFSFDAKKATIVIGLVGLVVFHVATKNYSMALNDALTIVAATHYGPVLDFLKGLNVPIPADPTTEPPTVLPTAEAPTAPVAP